MPDIDVSDVISDPGFQDSFQVIQSTATVGNGGLIAIVAGSPVAGTGVVWADNTTLRRLDDGSRLSGSINIITMFPLKAGLKADDVNSQPADIVIWRSRKYTVMAIQDWSDYGQGFIRAAADLLPLNPSV